MAGEIDLDRLPSLTRETSKMKFFLTKDKVEVFFKNDQCSISVNSRGQYVSVTDRNGNQRDYLIGKKLPEKVWKKYTVATKFIDLVRSKTSKVTFYTGNDREFKNLEDRGNRFSILKAVLMENRDFEISVRDYFTNSVQKIKLNKVCFPDNPNPFESKLELLYQHCLSVDTSLTNIEKISALKCFPVTLGTKTDTSKATDQASVNFSTAASSRFGKTATLPGIGIASQVSPESIALKASCLSHHENRDEASLSLYYRSS